MNTKYEEIESLEFNIEMLLNLINAKLKDHDFDVHHHILLLKKMKKQLQKLREE